MRTPWLPRLVVAPSFVLGLCFIYGLIAWNGYLSLSASRLLPNYEFVGFQQYAVLWESERFRVALTNMAIFGSLFIAGAMGIGLLLAVLLDQKIRAEGVLRAIYLYPMAISFIVTGTAWKWLLNPGLGLEHMVRSWGFESFSFDWLINPDKAIYCIAIAGVWQSAGFVMALFLAALRGVDDSHHQGRAGRRRQPAAHLPAHCHPEPAAGVLQHADGGQPPRDQELRPGDGADRRRPRLRHRPAGHLHVRDGLLARADRPGRGQRHGDAGPGVGHRRALPLFRTAGAQVKHVNLHRLLLWSVLLLFAAWFITPLYVMVATSLKDMEQVRTGSLLSLPTSPTTAAWSKAWGSACTGTDCGGLAPFFFNSLLIALPAVLISTALGSLNGYVLAKWRFPGSEFLFALLLFGVFMPMQVVLLPMSQVLGWLGIANSLAGLVLVHVLAGIPSTTLFFRNYYVGLPDELVKAAMLDGAGFWQIFIRIVLPLSTPILVVTLIWQFTQIWNDFLYGVVFSGADSKPITVGLNNLANTSSSVKEYNVDMAAALIAALPTLFVYVVAGKYFVRGLTAGAVKG